MRLVGLAESLDDEIVYSITKDRSSTGRVLSSTPNSTASELNSGPPAPLK